MDDDAESSPKAKGNGYCSLGFKVRNVWGGFGYLGLAVWMGVLTFASTLCILTRRNFQATVMGSWRSRWGLTGLWSTIL